MRLHTILLFLGLLCGCQTENVSVVINGNGGEEMHRTTATAKVWYDGNYAEANKIYIIKIDRSPIDQGQTQKDVGSGNEASATGL